MNEQTQRRQGYDFVYDADQIADIAPHHFDTDWWASQNRLIGHAQGRGTVAFIEAGETGWVLRHYMRGGAAAKLLTDQYLWLGVNNTRAFREWRLLAQLRALGLPVPQPVAARVQRRGLGYRADLITARIPNAQTLAEILQKQRLEAAHWQALGRLLARFHNHGAYHHDLNAHNIMLNEAYQFTLIDFDKGRMRRPGGWCQSVCNRLQRSLQKLSAANTNFHYTQTDWQALLGGYLAASDAGVYGSKPVS